MSQLPQLRAFKITKSHLILLKLTLGQCFDPLRRLFYLLIVNSLNKSIFIHSQKSKVDGLACMELTQILAMGPFLPIESTTEDFYNS